MTTREQCELTMANHGDAYRLIIWPTENQSSAWSSIDFIRNNWEAIYNLVCEGNKHHNGLTTVTLYNIAVQVLTDWCYDKYNR